MLSESVFGHHGPSPTLQITDQKGGGRFSPSHSHSSLQATEAPVSQETLLVREEIKGGLLKTLDFENNGFDILHEVWSLHNPHASKSLSFKEVKGRKCVLDLPDTILTSQEGAGGSLISLSSSSSTHPVTSQPAPAGACRPDAEGDQEQQQVHYSHLQSQQAVRAAARAQPPLPIPQTNRPRHTATHSNIWRSKATEEIVQLQTCFSIYCKLHRYKYLRCNPILYLVSVELCKKRDVMESWIIKIQEEHRGTVWWTACTEETRSSGFSREAFWRHKAQGQSAAAALKFLPSAGPRHHHHHLELPAARWVLANESRAPSHVTR